MIPWCTLNKRNQLLQSKSSMGWLMGIFNSGLCRTQHEMLWPILLSYFFSSVLSFHSSSISVFIFSLFVPYQPSQSSHRLYGHASNLIYSLTSIYIFLLLSHCLFLVFRYHSANLLFPSFPLSCLILSFFHLFLMFSFSISPSCPLFFISYVLFLKFASFRLQK